MRGIATLAGVLSLLAAGPAAAETCENVDGPSLDAVRLGVAGGKGLVVVRVSGGPQRYLAVPTDGGPERELSMEFSSPQLASGPDRHLLVDRNGGRVVGLLLDTEGRELGAPFTILESAPEASLFVPAAFFDGRQFTVIVEDNDDVLDKHFFVVRVSLDGAVLQPGVIGLDAPPSPSFRSAGDGGFWMIGQTTAQVVGMDGGRGPAITLPGNQGVAASPDGGLLVLFDPEEEPAFAETWAVAIHPDGSREEAVPLGVSGWFTVMASDGGYLVASIRDGAILAMTLDDQGAPVATPTVIGADTFVGSQVHLGPGLLALETRQREGAEAWVDVEVTETGGDGRWTAPVPVLVEQQHIESYECQPGCTQSSVAGRHPGHAWLAWLALAALVLGCRLRTCTSRSSAGSTSPGTTDCR